MMNWTNHLTTKTAKTNDVAFRVFKSGRNWYATTKFLTKKMASNTVSYTTQKDAVSACERTAQEETYKGWIWQNAPAR